MHACEVDVWRTISNCLTCTYFTLKNERTNTDEQGSATELSGVSGSSTTKRTRRAISRSGGEYAAIEREVNEQTSDEEERDKTRSELEAEVWTPYEKDFSIHS